MDYAKKNIVVIEKYKALDSFECNPGPYNELIVKTVYIA